MAKDGSAHGSITHRYHVKLLHRDPDPSAHNTPNPRPRTVISSPIHLPMGNAHRARFRREESATEHPQKMLNRSILYR